MFMVGDTVKIISFEYFHDDSPYSHALEAFIIHLDPAQVVMVAAVCDVREV